LSENKSASAAERPAPVSAAEARLLFGALGEFPNPILAVSGGPDSTALLVLAARWRTSSDPPPRLVAVTVDHGLRPEAKREAQAVARLARSLGIEHRTLRWTGRKPKTGLQKAARQARYRLLAGAARKVGARHIVTAHTLDDQAETVLFRMARGSGVGGLSGMAWLAPVPVPEGAGIMLFRPLLRVPKARLIATLRAAKIPYATDPSNRDPRFARPRLRALMPALAREGLTAERLGLLASRIERVEDALDDAVNEAQTKASPSRWSPGGPVTVAAKVFAELPSEIRLRLLGRAIEFKGDEGPVELGKLEALCAAMSDALSDAADGNLEFARFRRTLAGALVTLDGAVITIDRAPPRRRASKRP
jgi:tRNA(Ile)-lysidine synthase